MTLLQSAEIHNVNKYPEYVGYELFDSGYDYVVYFKFNKRYDCTVPGTCGTGVKHYDTRKAAVNAGLRYLSKF